MGRVGRFRRGPVRLFAQGAPEKESWDAGVARVNAAAVVNALPGSRRHDTHLLTSPRLIALTLRELCNGTNGTPPLFSQHAGGYEPKRFTLWNAQRIPRETLAHIPTDRRVSQGGATVL